MQSTNLRLGHFREVLRKRRNELAILGIAVTARVLAALIRVTFGIRTLPFLPGTIAFSDFFSVNGPQLKDLALGLIPYSNFGYWYTPLFLYAIYPFYILGGMEGATIPILATDAATAVLVYLLVRTRSSDKIALIAGATYALSPFVLYEEGYLLLSSQPMLFFLLLSIYCLIAKKPLSASILFGISVLFKQEALFVLPAYIAWYLVKYREIAWKGLLLFAGVVAIACLPFLLLSPAAFLADTSYGIIPLKAGSNLVTTSNVSFESVTSSLLKTCSSLIPTSNLWSSFVACGATYSWSPPTILDRLSILTEVIIWAIKAAELELLVVLGAILYFSRRRSNFLPLFSAYSLVAFLILFSYTVHLLLSYYFLPVYALLLASATTKNSAIFLIIISAVSILIPDGTSQTVLFSIFGILFLLLIPDAQLLPRNEIVIS